MKLFYTIWKTIDWFLESTIEMYLSKINQLNWKNNSFISLKCRTVIKGQMLHLSKKRDFSDFKRWETWIYIWESKGWARELHHREVFQMFQKINLGFQTWGNSCVPLIDWSINTAALWFRKCFLSFLIGCRRCFWCNHWFVICFLQLFVL